jgi:hypothetical protein
MKLLSVVGILAVLAVNVAASPMAEPEPTLERRAVRLL